MQVAEQDLLFTHVMLFCHGQLLERIALSLLLLPDQPGIASLTCYFADTLRFTQVTGDGQVSPRCRHNRQYNQKQQQDAA